MSELDNLKTARSNLCQLVADKTTEWLSAGAPPTYSIDGASWNWGEWLATQNKAIDDLTTLINRMSAPWSIRRKGRP